MSKEKPKRLTIDIPEDLHRRLKVLAATTGRDMRELATEGIVLVVVAGEKNAKKPAK